MCLFEDYLGKLLKPDKKRVTFLEIREAAKLQQKETDQLEDVVERLLREWNKVKL